MEDKQTGHAGMSVSGANMTSPAEHIDLIASGYEWDCPTCGTLNNLAGIPSRAIVHCTRCRQHYRVKGVDHAFD